MKDREARKQIAELKHELWKETHTPNLANPHYEPIHVRDRIAKIEKLHGSRLTDLDRRLKLLMDHLGVEEITTPEIPAEEKIVRKT